MKKWYSKVYVSDWREIEEERTFQESYFRVIEIANEYIDEWYKIYKMWWAWIMMTKDWKSKIQIWHSNWVDFKWNIYINTIR